MKVTLDIERVTIITSKYSTDQICLHFSNPTPFPIMGYQGTACINTQAEHGAEWLKTVLGITTFEIVDSSTGERTMVND